MGYDLALNIANTLVKLDILDRKYTSWKGQVTQNGEHLVFSTYKLPVYLIFQTNIDESIWNSPRVFLPYLYAVICNSKCCNLLSVVQWYIYIKKIKIVYIDE